VQVTWGKSYDEQEVEIDEMEDLDDVDEIPLRHFVEVEINGYRY